MAWLMEIVSNISHCASLIFSAKKRAIPSIPFHVCAFWRIPFNRAKILHLNAIGIKLKHGFLLV